MLKGQIDFPQTTHNSVISEPHKYTGRHPWPVPGPFKNIQNGRLPPSFQLFVSRGLRGPRQDVHRDHAASNLL